MLARIVNMRGVNLNEFDFDFDLTWAAFFMNADGHIYGRYGSRDEGPAEAGLSLKGLKYAMAEALQAYRANPQAAANGDAAKKSGLPARPELYPAAGRLKKDSCIHCHQVYNFQHDWYWAKKTWTKDRIWKYPPPKTIGLALEVDQGDKVKSVEQASAAAKAGLKVGDVLASIDKTRVSSPADVMYALNRAPKSGTARIEWTRDGKAMSGTMTLDDGWRKADFAWRASMWTTPPSLGIYGRDLSVQQKRKLGLDPKRLAFAQGRFVPNKTRRAGFRGGDVIIGVDGKELELTMRQFNAWMRTNYKVGDTVTFDVIRNGRRMKIPWTLPRNPR